MVTFARNPYDWVDEEEINTAVLSLDMTYKNKPVPASSVRNGIGVTVPTRMSVNQQSFTNATLSDDNNHTAVLSLKRGSAASVLQLYVYVGKVTPQDIESFDNLRKTTFKRPFIFPGFVNVTLFHGNSSAALDAFKRGQLYHFAPVWFYNFRFVNVAFVTLPVCQLSSCHSMDTSSS